MHQQNDVMDEEKDDLHNQLQDTVSSCKRIDDCGDGRFEC